MCKIYRVSAVLSGLLIVSTLVSMSATAREHVVIGIDDKVAFKESGLVKVAPTTDYVCFLAIDKDPLKPRLDCSLELENSIFGPPVNVSVTPDERFAVVANSVSWLKSMDGGETVWAAEPDTDVYLIDLKGKAPKVVSSVTVPKQPSGIAVSRNGKYVAVAHRAAKAVSLLRLDGTELSVIDTLAFQGEISAVAFGPGDTRVFASHFDGHQIVMMDIKSEKLVNAGAVPVGLWPYNIKVDPNGRIAIAANTGNKGLPDGNIDTISIIDIQAPIPHVINTLSVGDGPEGLVFSPNGEFVAVALLQGSGAPFKKEPFYSEHGGLVIYRVNDKSLEEIARFEIGGFPEGMAFTKDSSTLFVGNLLDKNVEIFTQENGEFIQTGKKISLPGQPVSMGSGSP